MPPASETLSFNFQAMFGLMSAESASVLIP